MQTVPDLPLFALPIVALPRELVPLHIFEERYKRMVAHCLDEACELGIVRTGETVGCACEIAEVLERFPDGRLNIVVRGTRPFHIDAQPPEGAFPTAAVTFLADEPAPADPDLLARAHAAYAELVATATARTPDAADIAAMSAYDMAATVELGLDAKQRLLSLRSEPARLELLVELFHRAARRLAAVERARERARSNGRVHLPPEVLGG